MLVSSGGGNRGWLGVPPPPPQTAATKEACAEAEAVAAADQDIRLAWLTGFLIARRMPSRLARDAGEPPPPPAGGRVRPVALTPSLPSLAVSGQCIRCLARSSLPPRPISHQQKCNAMRRFLEPSENKVERGLLARFLGRRSLAASSVILDGRRISQL